MDQARELVRIYNIEIILGLLVAFLVLLALYLIAEIRISKLKDRYNQLVRGYDGIDIEDLLIKNSSEIDELKGNY